MKKTYLVQCWNIDGTRQEHYETVLEGDAATLTEVKPKPKARRR